MTKALGVYWFDGTDVRLVHGYGAPNDPPVTPVGPEAGALPIGTAAYTIPLTNVIYLDDTGSDSNDGLTANRPKGTLQAAVSACPSGGTIVVRGGEYRQKYVGDMTKPLTIMNYPGETVWFDGSTVVPTSSWTNNGNGTWSCTLLAQFAHGAGANGTDDPTRYVNSAYPMALWPDGVWVNGTRLRQVDSTVTPNSTQFNVNYTTNKATIGQDPTGKEVRLTERDFFMIVKAKVNFLGFGIRRYADDSTRNMVHCVTASGGSLFENMWLVDAALQATSILGTGTTWRYNTFQNAGYLTIGTDTCANATITNNIIEGSNFENMKEQPYSGAIKLVRATNALVRDNVFRNNNCSAVWCDVSCNDVKVINNDMLNNLQGVNYEISHKVTVVNNRIIGITKAGVQICDSDVGRVYNNIIDRGTSYDVWVHEDNRAGVVSAGENPDGVQTWTTVSTEVCNNIFTNYQAKTGTWRLYFDSGASEDASAYFTLVSGNVWSTTSSSSSTSSISRMAAVGQTGSTPIYTSPTAFQTAYPTKVLGTNLTTAIQAPNDSQIASFQSAGRAIPNDICDLLGIAHGTKAVGPILPLPVARS